VHAWLAILVSGKVHKEAQVATYALQTPIVMLQVSTKQHACAFQASQEMTEDLALHAA